jgi:general secretion pathway protein G
MALFFAAPLTRGERATRAGGFGFLKTPNPPFAFGSRPPYQGVEKRQRGFTLIELMITVAIIGLLASVALPLAEVQVQRNKETDLRRSLREVREAIDAYKRASDEGAIEKPVNKSGYPPSLDKLVEGAVDKRDPKGGRLYFLRRIPADPMTGQEWGLRAYASPPDAPQKGDDVYDVYSLSEDTGLNGIRYREW